MEGGAGTDKRVVNKIAVERNAGLGKGTIGRLRQKKREKEIFLG